MIQQGDRIRNNRTGQRMIFLKTWAETNGIQLQIECSSPPNITREPEHIHPYQENRFTIISGKLTFRINGAEQTHMQAILFLFLKIHHTVSGIQVQQRPIIYRNFFRH